MRIYKTIDVRKFEDKKFLNEALANASDFRKKKYEAINNHLGKLQVIANTYLLNECLKEIGLNEKDMEYIVEKNGKLRFANAEKVHFNLSHSKNRSLAVVSDKPVGCDIQFVDKVDEKLYDLVLSDSEKKLVVGASIASPNTIGSSEDVGTDDSSIGASIASPKTVGASSTSPAEKFYEFWAMKEAIIKKDGTGLRDRLTDVHDERVYIEKIILKQDGIVEKYIIAII